MRIETNDFKITENIDRNLDHTVNEVELSTEQAIFIEEAIKGKNILVDACIGSGKTTAIQSLCQRLPQNKHILYLTYNRLLKLDAQKRITNKNVVVNNYHGFAYSVLAKNIIFDSVQNLIKRFLREKPEIDCFDVIVIDEYQDIDQELSEMLEYIKSKNPDVQILAVGDMDQKIFDKTTLDIRSFIHNYLGNHISLTFSKCFRLSHNHAAWLGEIWNKTIEGVNQSCEISNMSIDEVISFLAEQRPADILCLGARTGEMSAVLNALEMQHPDRFNKKTVYASIYDEDNSISNKKNREFAIFTTYDSSKGLERKICVVFDFTEEYWKLRMSSPLQNYRILRNIFCVAASRGKDHIVFAGSTNRISQQTLSTPVENPFVKGKFDISSMFDFMYREDIEDCISSLRIKRINEPANEGIVVNTKDELIDLSPCIGVFQEANYFLNYNIDKNIGLHIEINPKLKKWIPDDYWDYSIKEKILLLTSIETSQKRYMDQVKEDWISETVQDKINERLSTVFSPDENVQVPCMVTFAKGPESPVFETSFIFGFADVVKDKTVYELKFVSELSYEHILQCACYMYALNLKKGVLWNTRTNEKLEISFRFGSAHLQKTYMKMFMDKVIKTITKHTFQKFYDPAESNSNNSYIKNAINPLMAMEELRKSSSEKNRRKEEINRLRDHSDKIHLTDEVKKDKNLSAILAEEKIAVIDIETNYDQQIISIGIVIATKKEFRPVGGKYYLIYPEHESSSLFYQELIHPNVPFIRECCRLDAINEVKKIFTEENVVAIFAYNAQFDYRQLSELHDWTWYDIMRVAAYRQYNKSIPKQFETTKTGRLTRNYGVESIYRLLSGNSSFFEVHNALEDAVTELSIMQMLGLSFEEYSIAQYPSIEKHEKKPQRSRVEKNLSSQGFTLLKYKDLNSPITISCNNCSYVWETSYKANKNYCCPCCKSGETNNSSQLDLEQISGTQIDKTIHEDQEKKEDINQESLSDHSISYMERVEFNRILGKIRRKKLKVIDFDYHQNKIILMCPICESKWEIQSPFEKNIRCELCYNWGIRGEKEVTSDTIRKIRSARYMLSIYEKSNGTISVKNYLGPNRPIDACCEKCGWSWNPLAKELEEACICPNCDTKTSTEIIPSC